MSKEFNAVSFSEVLVEDRFWAPRLKVNREVTLEKQCDELKTTGRIDALTLSWKPGDPNEPHIFWESDIAKWIEASAYSLSSHPDPVLQARLDQTIALLEGAQQADGYLNVHFTVVHPENRWTNLRDNHELYCAGHLIEAAVAHKQATGSDRLLNVMCRYAQYIGTVFGTGPGQLRGYCGHEEIELALIKLAGLTGDHSYLALAQYFVDERGREPHYFDIEAEKRGHAAGSNPHGAHDYSQAEMPVRELSKVAGHSVRAMYLYSAMADLARITGDLELKAANERLWSHLVHANMYVTGGIGSSRHNEGFTKDYDLPNQTAYAETCAAIGLVFWAHRLLHLDLDGQYADVVERALYNGVISGVSLDGAKFLYENPLASDGSFHRQDWFGCACCPPNLARILASFGGYLYSQSADGVAVHLYVQSSARLMVGGTRLKINQVTEYPWDGEVKISLELDSPLEFDLRLRLPGWCRKHRLTVGGKDVDARLERGYLVVRRQWNNRDEIVLTLDMPVELIQAHPKVLADSGRVAIQRGPVVYCLENADNTAPVSSLSIDRSTKFDTTFVSDLLGGVVVIECDGKLVSSSDWGATLYRPIEPDERKVRLRAVPYSTWDNRSPGEMIVWIPFR